MSKFATSLNASFIKKFERLVPPWGPIGYVTYKRTYARLIRELGRTEEWNETCARCCNSILEMGGQYTKDEIELLFEYMFTLKCIPAGRFLWQLGTDTVRKNGSDSLMNCWFTELSTIENFCFIFDELMLGGGTGYSVLSSDVYKLPKILPNVYIIRQDTNDADFIIPDTRLGWVELLRKVLNAYLITGKSLTYSTVCIRSKGAPIKGFGGMASGPEVLAEGISKISQILRLRENKYIRPIDALDISNIIASVVVAGNTRRCLRENSLIHSKNGLIPIKDIQVNDLVLTTKGYRKVTNKFYQGKQKLVRIKTTSSQIDCTENHRLAKYYNPEIYLWKTVDNLSLNDSLVGIQHNAENIKSIEYLNEEDETYDIEVEEMHEFFVEGLLSHNSAQIAIGAADDKKYLNAKNWALGNIPNWRAMSNNTVATNTIDNLDQNFWQGYDGSGEPYGLFNRDLCRSYGRLLDGKDYRPDYKVVGLNPCGEITLESGPKGGECCCLTEIFLPNVKDMQEFHKIIEVLYKVNKTVLQNKFSWPSTEEIVRRNQRIGIGVTGIMQRSFTGDEFSEVYRHLEEYDLNYSKQIGANKSIKLTTCKPSGTVSLLPGVTPGVHPAYSEYYIRRVRFAANDPLITDLRKNGYPIEPVVKFDGTYDHDTLVVSFPIKSPEGTTLAKDVTAIKQLETQRFIQTYWSDNSVSATVYYRKEELPVIKQWLKDNYTDTVKSVSFLLHNEHGFKQAPYEEITEQQFSELNSKVKPITKIKDKTEMDLVDSMECASGICPIK